MNRAKLEIDIIEVPENISINEHWGSGFYWKYVFLVYEEGSDTTYMIQGNKETGFELTVSASLTKCKDADGFLIPTPQKPFDLIRRGYETLDQAKMQAIREIIRDNKRGKK